MQIKNFEFKAKTETPMIIQETLIDLGADYKGCDHQIDTYFNVTSGRLKLRQGNIENSLIFYKRANTKNSKESDISFSKVDQHSDNILDVLTHSLGIKKIVNKKRHIYFIDHVKFHVDFLDGLGSFVEVEVIDENNEYSNDEMKDLCDFYQMKLGVKESDLIDLSYSDMVL